MAVEFDITARKQAEEALQQLNVQLESRVEKRTAELQAANQALLESRRSLQILSQRLVEVQEEERRAIARELHDRVGQTLSALNLNLLMVSNQISGQLTHPIQERLADSMMLVTEMIEIVRDVMSELRPVVLDEFGLVAALNAYVGKYEARYGIPVKFAHSDVPIPRLGDHLEMTVLRIVQEALVNVARHSHADHVSMSVQWEQNAITLVIQDNGVGIPSSQEIHDRGSRGLMIMHERAEAVGGTLKIVSVAPQGTIIEATIPWQNNDGNDSTGKEGVND